MYADTDFLFALASKEDRFNRQAEMIYKENRGRIRTSTAALIEILLVSRKKVKDLEELILSIGYLLELPELRELAAAAHYMKKFGAEPFDAVHAAFCGDDFIISSDAIYDKIGIPRIRLGS